MKKLTMLATFVATLAVPLVLKSQTTVFQDTFAGSSVSTFNPTAASPGTLNATNTAYCVAASKDARGSTIGSGAFNLTTVATSSGYIEAQARFTNAPIVLNAAGQYVEIFYTMTANPGIFNGQASTNMQLNIGLFNTGQSGPTNGGFLWNAGLSASSNQVPTGACQNWLGYIGQIAFTTNTGPVQSSSLAYRPPQIGANNLNQGLGLSSGAAGLNSFTTYAGISSGSGPVLTNGSQYTVDLKIQYVTATQIAVTNTLYFGAGNGGTIYSSGGWTGQFGGIATNLTTTFDGFEIGLRPTGPKSGAVSVTNKITGVTVISYIPTAPTIAGLTNQTVIQGNNTTLSATITGVPTPAYQWQTNGVNIGGATSPTLALSNVQYAQNGWTYSLVASNFVGSITNSMTLSVIVPPSIAGLSDQAVSSGNTASLNPTVSGVPTPTLQWRYNGANLTDGLTVNGSTIAGSTSNPLTITGAQSGDSGTYSLVASNSAGMVTNSMYLTVGSGNVAPILTGPTNITVIQGNNGTFSATVSGLPVPTLQWLNQTGTPITSATNNTLVLSSVLYSQNGYVYSLVASNSVGSVTNSATLTVIVPPAITSQPSSLTVTNTQSASFTVAATGVPSPTYQWYKNASPFRAAPMPAPPTPRSTSPPPRRQIRAALIMCRFPTLPVPRIARP